MSRESTSRKRVARVAGDAYVCPQRLCIVARGVAFVVQPKWLLDRHQADRVAFAYEYSLYRACCHFFVVSRSKYGAVGLCVEVLRLEKGSVIGKTDSVLRMS